MLERDRHKWTSTNRVSRTTTGVNRDRLATWGPSERRYTVYTGVVVCLPPDTGAWSAIEL